MEGTEPYEGIRECELSCHLTRSSVSASVVQRSLMTPTNEKGRANAQKILGEQKLFEEKLLPSLVWDKTRFEREGGI